MTAPEVEKTGAGAIPLILVSGFLGSGKTTLINAVLKDPAFAGTMVIVNEFGDVGLDHLLVSSAEDQVVLLDSGCLCCAASGSLRDTLIDLFTRRASGDVPYFNRIIVETSGLAHPGPLVASVLGDSALVPRCVLSQMLTLVDAANGIETLDRYAEARHQVAFADTLLINKTDAASEDQIQELRSVLAAMNEQAFLKTWHCDMAAIDIFQPPAQKDLPIHCARPEAWLRRPLFSEGADGVMRGPHGTDFMKIRSHLLQPIPSEMDWNTYARWTHAASTKLGKRLLRCKGVLALGEGSAPWIVQSVQGFFAPPQKLTAWPNDAGKGFLVCIGDGVFQTELEALMEPSPFQFSSSSDQQG